MVKVKKFCILVSLILLTSVFIYCESPTKPERDAPLDSEGINYQVPNTPSIVDPGHKVGFGEIYTVSWNKVERAINYVVEESLDSLFVTAIPDTVSEISKDLQQYLNVMTTYYYRVKGINGEYGSGWSGTVDIIVNSLDVPLIDSDYETIISGNEYSITWATVDSAQTYTLQESTDSTFNNAVEISADTSSYKTSHNTELRTSYYYRVKALHNDNTSGWSNVIDITITPPIPVPPILESPVVHWNKVTLNWNTVSYATSYTIEESDNIDFNQPDIYDIENTISKTILFNIDVETPMFYRIKANGVSGSSEWSSTSTCTLIPYQLALTVSDNEVFSEEDYSLSWNDVIATSYTIEEASNSNFSNPKSITVDGTIKSFNYYSETQQTYYYRIRAYDGNNTSDWSNTITVVITPPVPKIPVLDEANVIGNQVTLNWIAVKYATSYRVEADTDSSFSNAINNETDTPSYTYAYNLDSTTTYYYRVKTLGVSGSSGWSNEVYVTMEPVKHELIMEINPSSSGTTEPSAGNYTYNENTVVMIWALPSQGYRFVNWTGEVSNVDSDTTTVTMTGAKTVTANFIKTYTLTMGVNQSGWGTTTPAIGSHTYDENTDVNITATPAEGYQFVNWTGSVANTSSSSTTITTNSGLTVIANFEEIPQSTEITLVSIPAGTFQMGDIQGGGDSDELPIHSVTLSSFEMGTYEVTQWQYESLMGSNPSTFKGDDYPIETISWLDAVKFCNEYSILTGLEPCYDETTWECDFSKNGYRLPTEAEWEYACRAGTDTYYSFGNDTSNIYEYAWFLGNSNNSSHPVAQKMPNPWGLYDMHGNVFEFCNDWYSSNYYHNSPSVNPIGPESGDYIVIRGGDWSNYANDTRSAHKSMNQRYYVHAGLVGFRLVRGTITPGTTTYTISGTVSSADGVTVTLSGDTSGSQLVDDGGSYSFTVEQGGNYTITPSKIGYTFTPVSQTFSNVSANQTQDFTASQIAVPTEITMVSIPAVTTPYVMGGLYSVTLSAYEMSATEITNAQYASYLNSALSSGDIEITDGDVYGKTGDWSGQQYLDIGFSIDDFNKCWIQYSGGIFSVTSGKENRPVIAVTWYGSKAFTEFYGYDLPTEAEWQYAASGGMNYEYGTNDGTISSNANYSDNSVG
ncbi:SUMF1/EgtB/PvdO family nonheme iron enzyme [Candidatus Latescibacterota bacterium]